MFLFINCLLFMNFPYHMVRAQALLFHSYLPLPEKLPIHISGTRLYNWRESLNRGWQVGETVVIKNLLLIGCPNNVL